MTEREEVEVQLPLSLAAPDGEYAIAHAFLVVLRGNRGIAELDDLTEIDNEPDWTEDCGNVYFEILADGKTLRALRVPTCDDYRILRVPRWIQYDETPQCCGHPMFFVGDLDEPLLWKERPPSARRWWHDAAAFYVFTCPVCLSVRAIGQQF